MEYSTNDKIHTSCVETILEVIDNQFDKTGEGVFSNKVEVNLEDNQLRFYCGPKCDNFLNAVLRATKSELEELIGPFIDVINNLYSCSETEQDIDQYDICISSKINTKEDDEYIYNYYSGIRICSDGTIEPYKKRPIVSIDNRKEDFCHEDIIYNCSNTIIEVDVSNNSIDLEKILELYDCASKKFEGIHVSIRC